jgi:hypothetical protein
MSGRQSRSKMKVDLIIHLDVGTDQDLRGLERASVNLRSELGRLDGVESVQPLSLGKAPVGSKVADPLSAGSILMTLAASGGVLTSLIGVLKDWLGRREGRKISLQIGQDKLEITGLPTEAEKELIEAFFRKHKAAP